jgi:hypothetical protein
MGAASDGKMPWTGVLYDIFAYCAAVNAAAVGGYGDWRVMNAKEWFSIVLHAGNGAYDRPDGTAFPNVTISTTAHWTSSTDSNTTTIARCGGYQSPVTRAAKTTAYYAMLVRGGR